MIFYRLIITKMFLKNDSGHLMCQFEGRRGTRKGSSLSSTYIPAICLQHIFLQHVFNTYSLPSLSSTHTPSPQKRGGVGVEGAYYTIFKKKTIAAGKFSYDISGRN